MEKSRLFLLYSFTILLIGVSPGYSDQIHILKKNETLYSIARRYNSSVDELRSFNEIDDPTNLQVGMKIRIPALHRVEKGETLYGIAREYNISLDELKYMNSFEDGDVLRAGQLLRVPGKNISGETAEHETDNTAVAEKNDEKEASVTTNSTKRDEHSGKDEREAVTAEKWPVGGSLVQVDGKLKGVQIQGKRGDPVRSISSGSVIWAGPYRGFGNVVMIESANRYVYVYGGIESIQVSVGDATQPGMVISTLGINPHSKESELFFTVFRDGKPVDPENAPRL